MSGAVAPAGVLRRTFVSEAVRAVAAGLIETSLATFAVLIAVNRFESGAAVKALLLASPAAGLLGSLVIVPLVVRSGLTASRAAAVISLASCGGFAFAAANAQSETCFVFGTFLGTGIVSMAIPLQTHYLRLNYPDASRGRLFSATISLRALTSLAASWIFGVYLDADFDRYPTLLWCLAGAAAVAAVCHLAVPSDRLRPERERHRFLESVHVTRGDGVYTRLLAAAMVFGIGVLAANALRVDYLANPRYGLQLDVATVSLVTGIVPSLVRLATTFFWGWLFDRVDFFRLRVSVNFVFVAALLLYFVGPSLGWIIVGSALFGLARGGGEVLFNLWVTKIAPSERIADYMSVHTFLAGVRILAAPFVGFLLAEWANIPVMVTVSATLTLLSIGIVVEAARKFRRPEA